jgi:outer membrane receptor protein involved in Fe transport
MTNQSTLGKSKPGFVARRAADAYAGAANLKHHPVHAAVRCALMTSAAMAVAALPAHAQEGSPTEEIIVTGTRIQQPGVVSSSPIYTIGSEEILRQQEPEIEKLLRLLPITAAGDNQNVNNGTEGAATIDLRGLGTQRNLVMLNGKRMVPFSFDGEVDTAMIPTALIDRIDIITGGATAVYGSDAISGALNVILKNDFEGVDIQWNTSQTGEGDGEDTFTAVTLGANAADGRGNVVLSFGVQDRDPITLGARPLGRLGITTSNGANYAQFLAGQPPLPPTPDCTGPDAVLTGGSGTTLPTRVSIAGGPSLGQFRNDGTLGANCSTFNFNPYNYYQTPLKRYNGTVIGNFEFDEAAEVYSMFNYGKTKVQSLVAPSGIFGSNFFTPLSNPLLGAQARQFIIDAANTGRLAGTVNVAGIPNTATPNPNDTLFENWRDLNGNGVVDAADDLNIAYFRRTVELGPRSEDITGELFQFTVGLRGDITDNWSYDASLQYGESNRVLYRAGYTNVTATEAALQSIDGTTCLGGQAGCVPINLFGGFGAITPAMAAFASASAFRQQDYEQVIATAYATGSFDALQLPSADSPVAFSFGVERRDEYARELPDECLKVQPSSCLGGAGGFFAPLEGSYDVNEFFTEALIPIVDGGRGAQGLDLEFGYRYSDYDPSGSDDTWKAGINWRPVDPLLVRVMRQRAARAPNVGELADPQVTGLSNATMDPCSVENAGNITPQLAALCIATGMSAAQVGTVDDIIVGQINTFEGTDLDNLPQIEHADTTTVGVVWTPDFQALQNPIFSLDYYDIDISNYIDTFSAQEVLDGCYELALASECAKVRRIGGNLILDGSGVEIFTTNLKYIRAEGVELGFSFGLPISRGDLQFSGTVNKYLTHEFQSRNELPVVDCAGYFGTSCEQPRSDLRFIQRTTWNYNNLSVSAQWRHLSETDREIPERTATSFAPFLTIDSFDYLDLYASYRIRDRYLLSFGALNVTDEDPPVVGNEAGDTAFNTGNTFPGVYETLGRTYTFQVNITF